MYKYLDMWPSVTLASILTNQSACCSTFALELG